MAKENATFNLSIITPEKTFFDGPAQVLTFDTADGQISILPRHEQTVISVAEGEVRIKFEGRWKSAAVSNGMVTVTSDQTLMLVQTIEWPEDIDIARAEKEQRRAQEKLRQKASIQEYHLARASLARAAARLRIGSRKGKL